MLHLLQIKVQEGGDMLVVSETTCNETSQKRPTIIPVLPVLQRVGQGIWASPKR